MKIYQVTGNGSKGFRRKSDALKAARERAASTGHTMTVDSCNFGKLDKATILALFNSASGRAFERVRIAVYVPYGQRNRKTGMWRVKRE